MSRLAEGTRARLGAGLVCSLGAGLFSFHAVQMPGTEGLGTLIAGSLVPMVMALGLIGGVGWLWRGELPNRYLLRVAGWTVFGVAFVLFGVGMTLFYQRASGGHMVDAGVILGSSATGGSLFGIVLGVYDSRGQFAREQATDAREEAEHRNEQLTVLNRLLRHDIRNDATVIGGNVDVLATECPRGREAAERIARKSEQIVALAEQARRIEALVHDEGADRETIDLTTCVTAAIRDVTRDHPGLTVETTLPERLPVRAHPLATAAVRNVVENAAEHAGEDPSVAIDTERRHEAGTEYADLRIEDDGPGIPEEEVAVLKRGFETPLEHGFGLGLWLVEWIMRASDGTFSVSENGPEGTTVVLRFEADPDPDPAALADSSTPDAGATVGSAIGD